MFCSGEVQAQAGDFSIPPDTGAQIPPSLRAGSETIFGVRCLERSPSATNRSGLSISLGRAATIDPPGSVRHQIWMTNRKHASAGLSLEHCTPPEGLSLTIFRPERRQGW